MEPLDDYPIDRTNSHTAASPADPVAPSSAGKVWALIGIIAAVGLGVAAYLMFRQTPAAPSQAAEPPPPAPAAVEVPQASSTQVAPVVLPHLEESDPLVRELLSQLSSRPELAAWLATDNLLRAVAAGIDNLAAGISPTRHFGVLRPSEKFRAQSVGDRIVVDERSYARYDGIANTVASIDPAALVRVYATLKPRLSEAYLELGHPVGTLDGAIEQVLVQLLQTPVPDQRPALQEGIVSYHYDRDDLEDLTAAQKQLMRMGPRNVRIIQRQLRSLAAELGIPPSRLPAPRASTS